MWNPFSAKMRSVSFSEVITKLFLEGVYCLPIQAIISILVFSYLSFSLCTAQLPPPFLLLSTLFYHLFLWRRMSCSHIDRLSATVRPKTRTLPNYCNAQIKSKWTLSSPFISVDAFVFVDTPMGENAAFPTIKKKVRCRSSVWDRNWDCSDFLMHDT